MNKNKRRKQLERDTKTFTGVATPRQTITFVNGSRSTTQTTIIGSPSKSQQPPLRVPPQVNTSTMDPMEPMVIDDEEEPSLDFSEETRTKVSVVLLSSV